MKVSYSKVNECISKSSWLYHETRDFIRFFGIEIDFRVFKVLYPCGQKSILMNKKQAQAYTQIFKGKVIRG